MTTRAKDLAISGILRTGLGAGLNIGPDRRPGAGLNIGLDRRLDAGSVLRWAARRLGRTAGPAAGSQPIAANHSQ